MNIKLMAEQRLEFLSLKGGCTGLSESTLVKMPHCWKSYAPAQLSAIPLLLEQEHEILVLIPSFSNEGSDKSNYFLQPLKYQFSNIFQGNISR